MGRIMGRAFTTAAGGIRKIAAGLLVMAFSLIATGEAAQAQNPFAVAIRIDDAVITNYEIQQRIRFMQILNTQGDLREQAIEALINDCPLYTSPSPRDRTRTR